MQSVALSTQILPPCKISRIFDPTLFVVANDEFNTTFITYFYKFHPAINLNVQHNFLIESPIWILMSQNQPFTLITQTQLWPADCSFIVLMARLLAATEVGILQTWNISILGWPNRCLPKILLLLVQQLQQHGLLRLNPS